MKFSEVIFRRSSIKVFVISFIATFLMAIIPQLKMINTGAVSFVPQKVEEVEVKLMLKGSDFKLIKQIIQFVPVVSAGVDYENAEAYSLIDFDSGEVIASKNLTKKMPIASLTKIMTAVVALDLAGKDEQFTVSQKASEFYADFFGK